MVENASGYLDILHILWPIAVVGFFSACAFRLRDVLKEDTFGKALLSLFVSCIPAAVISCAVVLLLPYLFPSFAGSSPATELGLAIITGGMGTKAFDIWIRKKLNLEISDKKESCHG